MCCSRGRADKAALSPAGDGAEDAVWTCAERRRRTSWSVVGVLGDGAGTVAKNVGD